MGTQAVSPAGAEAEVRDSWVPMIVIAMGQILMSFNVAAIPVILGLITVGLGQGALVTLLFNVLVTSAPKELSGDVGSLRGVTQNLAAAVGTSLMGALLVGLLRAMILSNLVANPVIPPEFKRAEWWSGSILTTSTSSETSS